MLPGRHNAPFPVFRDGTDPQGFHEEAGLAVDKLLFPQGTEPT
jgi:hypothetical protein